MPKFSANAIQIASNSGKFNCGNKLGTSIYAGERYYYFVRLGFFHELNLQHDLGAVSLAINGNSGHIIEIKYNAQ